MLKEMITWEGFDGKPATKTLYFNLTRYEIAHDMELEVLQERFRSFQEDVLGESERDMTPPEIREMLDIFKTLVKHAYGERSADGKEFSKSEEIWRRFNDTGAFDAFIWYMFENPTRANTFMEGIWPKEIQEAAAKVREERPNVRPVEDVEIAQDATDDDIPSISSIQESSEDKSWSEYSEDELLAMDDVSFQQLLMRSRDGRNIPKILQTIGMMRMNRP